jgi:hypothetical protein
MIKYMTDMEIQLAQIVKELRMQVAALEVAMMELEDRGWVGLTDAEVGDIVSYPWGETKDWIRAIEAKLKEKNT